MDLFDKVVDIKQAKNKKDYKENEQTKLFEQVENLEPKNFKEMTDFFNNKMSAVQTQMKEQTDQNKRLANSLEAMLPEIQKARVNDETASINFSKDPDKKDLSNYDLKAPSEAKYPLRSGQIAKRLGISTPQQVGKMMKELKIKGDYLFHHDFETGNNTSSPRYTYASLKEVFIRLENPEKYEIDSNIAIYWRKRVKNIPS